MTIEDTRRLGIEFERRVQTMIPETEYANKLDSETIYSFLNQYQDKYVHDIYRNLDKIQSGSHLSAHVESVLQELMAEETIKITPVDQLGSKIVEDGAINIDAGDVIIATGRSISYKLPSDFYMYVRSVSQVSSTFSFKADKTQENNVNNLPIRIVPNQLVSQPEVWKLIETPHDSLRILRYPAAVLGNVNNTKVLTVIYDQYTTPEGIKMSYYKQPARFSLMTGQKCELPLDAFDDLVSGAVDLYVQYVAGAEARKRQIDEARRQVAKEQEANNARRGRNNE